VPPGKTSKSVTPAPAAAATTEAATASPPQKKTEALAALMQEVFLGGHME
jgi:hypothetical protein